MITLFIVPACGSAGDTTGMESFQRVSPASRTYSIDDFLAVGFKKSKHYDVEGLPEATDAWFGFWRPEGNQPVEYELRFYASHEDAVEHGTALAAEVTGKDAVLISDLVTWNEGASDRRRMAGDPSNLPGGGAERVVARYGDFAIFGDVVMLCEGTDSAQSMERCAALIDALRSLGS